VYYPPPGSVSRGIDRVLADPMNHRYQAVEGIPELRQGLAQKLAADNGIDPGRYELVVTAGSNMAFFNAILAICDPGDEVIILSPWYFNQEMAIRIADCVPVTVPTGAGYQPDPEAIEAAITPRTRAVVTISPNNPTGAVYEAPLLDAVNDLCRRHGLFHIHDEAYEYFVYGGARNYSPASRLGVEGHTISLYSLSKSHSFASWRVGYMLIPPELLGAVRKIQDTNVICPPVISQYAALEAIAEGRAYCAPMIERLDGVRRYLAERLAGVDGVEANDARGAFYVFLKLPGQGSDLEIVQRLVADHRVAVIPGSAFGVTGGRYLRVSYGALDPETAIEGIDRLCTGLAALVD
jgi:aspartate/methionine/tyrosine aminotransferase